MESIEKSNIEYEKVLDKNWASNETLVIKNLEELQNKFLQKALQNERIKKGDITIKSTEENTKNSNVNYKTNNYDTAKEKISPKNDTTTNLKKWCKSFLSVYVMVPNLVEAIDGLVRETALKTSLVKGVEEVSNKILNLTQQKINLLNLKTLTDKALSLLTDEQILILNCRYKDNLPVLECQKLLKLDYRTFYRKLDKAIVSFQKNFCFIVKREQKKLSSLFDDCFLGDVFGKIEKFENSNKTILSCQDTACKLIISRLRKFF